MCAYTKQPGTSWIHIDISQDKGIFLKGEQIAFFNVISLTSSPGDRLPSIIIPKLTSELKFVR